MSPILRFVGYSAIGTTAFLFDLGLLYVLYSTLLVAYIIAVPTAFLISTSLHYLVARRTVFSDTKRSQGTGYLYFLMIMVTNALIVTGLVYALVEYASVSVYIARTIVAGFVGIVSFFLNARYNFKVL